MEPATAHRVRDRATDDPHRGGPGAPRRVSGSGAFLGLALTVFTEPEEGTSEIGIILSTALYGAVVVALYMAFRHWAQRGRRDFSTQGKLDAEAYEVWVHPAHIYTAASTLGIPVLADREAAEQRSESPVAEGGGAGDGGPVSDGSA